MSKGLFAFLTVTLMASPLVVRVQSAPPGATPAPLPLPAVPAPLLVNNTKSNSARIAFSEMVHDFGKVKANDPLRVDFVFTNTGTSLLEVTEVRPQCGCTTAAAWDRQVEPGKSGKIPIQFNPGNFNGTVAKTVTVTCNDALQSVQTLQIRATIWRPLDIQPQYLYFMGVEGETTNDVKIAKIVNNLDEELTLEPPMCPNPRFKCELKTLKPGKEFELQVTYLGALSNTIPQGVITMKTSSTNVPLLTVTAYAMPQPAVAVMPQTVRLPPGPLTAEYRQLLTVRNNSSKDLKLSDAVVNADGVKVEINEVQPGKLFNVNLVFSPEFKQKPGLPFEFTVKTSHPNNPLLRVPIMPLPTSPNPVLASPVSIPSGTTKQ